MDWPDLSPMGRRRVELLLSKLEKLPGFAPVLGGLLPMLRSRPLTDEQVENAVRLLCETADELRSLGEETPTP